MFCQLFQIITAMHLRKLALHTVYLFIVAGSRSSFSHRHKRIYTPSLYNEVVIANVVWRRMQENRMYRTH